jgi:hypothetical protein
LIDRCATECQEKFPPVCNELLPLSFERSSSISHPASWAPNTQSWVLSIIQLQAEILRAPRNLVDSWAVSSNSQTKESLLSLTGNPNRLPAFQICILNQYTYRATMQTGSCPSILCECFRAEHTQAGFASNDPTLRRRPYGYKLHMHLTEGQDCRGRPLYPIALVR